MDQAQILTDVHVHMDMAEIFAKLVSGEIVYINWAYLQLHFSTMWENVAAQIVISVFP